MTYASQVQVNALLSRYTIDTASNPTIAEALTMIEGASNEIDSVLGARGITVPVTTPQYFLDYLEALNTYGAAAAILRSMFSDAIDGGETPAYRFWEDRFRQGLAGLKDGSAIPDGITGSTTGYVAPSTYLTVNPDTEVDLGDIAEPLFKIGKVF